jgi:predicted O-methyltransferase YrrM
VSSDAAELQKKLIWHDDNHLQVGDANFLLSLDNATFTGTESTLEQFLLLKNSGLVQSTLDLLPNPVHNMVEFGIFKGGSVALYEALLSPERFVGVEIRPDRIEPLDQYLERRHATDRVRLYYGTDQRDRKVLSSIAFGNFEGRSIDLVIDDGAHRYEASKTSLNVFLPLLRPGGVYLIEDWAWAHWLDKEAQEAVATDYSDQESPLTKLIFEAVMLAASRPGIIRDIVIDSSRAFLIRGEEDIANENFDISEAYMTSLWNMEFSLRSTESPTIGLWRRWVPLSVRKRVPPLFAAWAREHIPH